MKRFITLIGIMLLLVSCTSNDTTQKNLAPGNSARSVLKVKPAKLTEREQSIVTQMGINYQTFYTLDGEVKEGDKLVTSFLVYENGERGEDTMSSVSGADKPEIYDHALHSFHLQQVEGVTLLTIGVSNGFARSSTTIPKDMESFLFHPLQDEVTMTTGDSVYLAYLIGTSKDELSSGGIEDLKSLPQSVTEAEYAIVCKVELKEEHDVR